MDGIFNILKDYCQEEESSLSSLENIDAALSLLREHGVDRKIIYIFETALKQYNIYNRMLLQTTKSVRK